MQACKAYCRWCSTHVFPQLTNLPNIFSEFSSGSPRLLFWFDGIYNHKVTECVKKKNNNMDFDGFALGSLTVTPQ